MKHTESNETNIENHTGISYEKLKEKLFYNPSKQILTDAPEFKDYNEDIKDAIVNLIRQEPVQYRIQKAFDKVKRTKGEENIAKIAELGRTSRETVRKYTESGSFEN